eukprot:SAG22_NODE_136_length_18095_cov_19.897255_2_plen_188_part_00
MITAIKREDRCLTCRPDLPRHSLICAAGACACAGAGRPAGRADGRRAVTGQMAHGGGAGGGKTADTSRRAGRQRRNMLALEGTSWRAHLRLQLPVLIATSVLCKRSGTARKGRETQGKAGSAKRRGHVLPASRGSGPGSGAGRWSSATTACRSRTTCQSRPARRSGLLGQWDGKGWEGMGRAAPHDV